VAGSSPAAGPKSDAKVCFSLTDAAAEQDHRSGTMYIDWITWSIWSLGLALLLYWVFETTREFKALFSRKKGR
jgi:hypothetical protein